MFGRDVRVVGKTWDRYGRLVARVIADGKDVSLELVRAGLAWHFLRYSSDAELAFAEREARSRPRRSLERRHTDPAVGVPIVRPVSYFEGGSE